MEIRGLRWGLAVHQAGQGAQTEDEVSPTKVRDELSVCGHKDSVGTCVVLANKLQSWLTRFCDIQR